MARDRSNEETTTNAAVTETAVAPVAVVADERYRKVKNPWTGEVQNRKDFIKHCWVDRKMSRGQIAAQLTDMNSVENGGNGKKVAYQVVFAVIKKGTPGGPDPVAPVAAAEPAAA